MDFLRTHRNPSKYSTNRFLAAQSAILRTPINTCRNLTERPGIRSTIAMAAGGLYYIGKGDAARCDDCGLEISGWTLDMKPFEVHAQRSPQCSYVQNILPDKKLILPSSMNFVTTMLETSDDEKPTKRQKIEETLEIHEPNILNEVDLVKQMRKRTFSHWPHRTSPSSAQIVETGFFNCNVGDRVICLYCNLICQQWVPKSDDPWEIHKTLSPKCPYVIAVLKRQQTPSLIDANRTELIRGAHHKKYVAPKMRHASFCTWPDENGPSVDDLVRAGFFYTGTKTIVTCFYCNGSLQNWRANANPTIEHTRWFPHCVYAKQLCRDERYRIIKEQKLRQKEHNNYHISNGQLETNDVNANGESVQPSVTDQLSPLVAARLDLPISRSLLDRDFKLSIIRRCWEDQLLLKQDFSNDSDLLMACIILQKQIELGVEEGKNIIIPSNYMKQRRENYQTELAPFGPCAVCTTEQKRLACIPCGHLATYVSCANSLRLCPICQKDIKAFVRIYI